MEIGARRDGPNAAEQTYRAFISYSHADARQAARLHRFLERYRVPGAIAGELDLPARPLNPVFRDRDELASSSSLSDELERALSRSAALVVVCSPAAARSAYVNGEIELFRRLHGNARVFAFVVDGQPPQCFPPALLKDELGTTLEPLAADARSQADGPGLARLKLVAGLLGIGVDALRQREYRRQVQRMTAIAAMTAVLAATMGVLAVSAIVAREAAERRRDQSEDLIGFMVGDLRAQLEPIGQLALLESVGAKALDYFASLEDDDASDAVLLRRGQALHQLGEVYRDVGEPQRAIEAFRRSLDQMQSLFERRPDDVEITFQLSQAHYWLGSAYVYRCRQLCAADHEAYEAAKFHWDEYARLSAKLAHLDAQRLDWQLEVAWAENNLGVLANMRHRQTQAIEHYTRARGHFENLLAVDPHNQLYVTELANVHGGLCKAARASGRIPESLQHANRALQLELPLEDQGARNRYRVARWRAFAARALLDAGRPDGAVLMFQLALDDAEAVSATDPENTQWRAQVAESALWMGEALSDLNRLDTLTSVVQRGRNALSHLLALDESTEYPDWQELDLRLRLLEVEHGAAESATPTQRELQQFLRRYPGAFVTWAEWQLLRVLRSDEAEQGAGLQQLLRDVERQVTLAPARALSIVQAEILVRLGRRGAAAVLLQEQFRASDQHPRVVALRARVGLDA